MTHKLDSIELELGPDETPSQAAAKIGLSPLMRHTAIAMGAGSQLAKFPGVEVDGGDAFNAMQDQAAKARSGDLSFASDALLAQAHSLDATSTELFRRAFLNGGKDGSHEAFRSYMTLALKAQASCRATIEALARMHQPREQVVRHVHVYEGGQALVAEEFHHHARGIENAGSDHQPHAARARRAGERAALPGTDTVGHSVSVAGCAGQEPVPDARRGERKRRPPRKSERA